MSSYEERIPQESNGGSPMEVRSRRTLALTKEIGRLEELKAMAIRANEGEAPEEKDPEGKDAHHLGAKLDAGKVRPSLVLQGFAHAVLAVAQVGTFGAGKYSDDGWRSVPNGSARYTDALLRHLLAEFTGEARDPQSAMLHATHAAWNALARLELMLAQSREGDCPAATNRASNSSQV